MSKAIRKCYAIIISTRKTKLQAKIAIPLEHNQEVIAARLKSDEISSRLNSNPFSSYKQ
jgi:hypothetical protein